MMGRWAALVVPSPSLIKGIIMAKVYQLPIPVPGTVDVFPAQKYAIFGDDLAAVTTAGYLNDASLDTFPVSQNDIISAFYSYDINTGSGSYALFTVSISNLGVITLSAWANPGEVQLPTVLGDFAVFADASGTIKSIPKASATEASNAVTASGQAGVITTSALTTAASGSYAITWTNALISATSVIQLTLMGGTNTVKRIQFEVVPGAGSATLTIYNLDTSGALDGSVVLAYTVL